MPKRKKARQRPGKRLDRRSAKRTSRARKEVPSGPLPKPLDPYATKKPKGRPPKMLASEVTGRAYHYRLIFRQIWDHVGEQLLNTKTQDEVIQAFKSTAHQNEFEGIAPLVLEVLHDPDFPKRDKEARINFLAESLAARGVLTPRTSRDICGKERKKERHKSPYQILRHEFYIECSCGYKGPARENACRKCGKLSPV
jgi:hypothetical protein